MSEEKRQIAARIGRVFDQAANKLNTAGIEDGEIGRALIGIGLARLQAALGAAATAELLLTVAATLVTSTDAPDSASLQ